MSFFYPITPVLPADYPYVIAVWEASVRATHHFITEEDIAFFLPLVREGLPQFEVLVCTRDAAGLVSGFIGVDGQEIAALFVDPTWRSKGIGRALVNYAMNVCGATMVDVNEQNEQALGFYLKMGFRVVGRSERDPWGKPYPILHMQLVK